MSHTEPTTTEPAPGATPSGVTATSNRMLWLAFTGLIAAGLAVAVVLQWSLPDVPRLRRDAWRALLSQDHMRAEALAKELLDADPNSEDALNIAGRAVAGQGRLEEAITWFDRLPKSSDQEIIQSRTAAKRFDLKLGRKNEE